MYIVSEGLGIKVVRQENIPKKIRERILKMQSTTPPRSPKGDVKRTVSHHECGSPLGDKEGAVEELYQL